MSASTKPMSNELMPPGTGMMAVAVKVSSADALPVSPNVQGKAIAKRQANPFKLIVLSLLLLDTFSSCQDRCAVRRRHERCPFASGLRHAPIGSSQINYIKI